MKALMNVKSVAYGHRCGALGVVAKIVFDRARTPPWDGGLKRAN